MRKTLVTTFFLALTGGLVAQEENLPITGEHRVELGVLDRYMRGFMQRLAIPGGALAVTHKGRLVYDRGFGYADVAKQRPVQPTALFRVASVSKPFTAVAILQLVERGKLRLDDKVYDLLKPAPFGERKMDQRWKEVTVLHLLQHRGGWDRGKSFDPMFRSHVIAAEAGRNGPAMPWDIIGYMAGRRLDFDPGKLYAYSNFGYCLLGRVIEKVTGKNYDKHLQKAVMGPVGIRRMHIGASLLEKRHADEVCYYGQIRRQARSVFSTDETRSVPWPYGGFHLEAMDSHGAWIACASDLLRFACAFDEQPKSELLQPETIARMFRRPPGRAGHDEQGKPRGTYYACGWLVRSKRGQDHGGSLPGTTVKLVRGGDGIHWVVLFNSRRDGKGTRIRPERFESGLRSALLEIRKWPDGDLFDY